MRSPLNFLTEEGRTRSKNARRRILGYVALMLLVAGVSAYGIYRFWVRSNLTPLQRIYLPQYRWSALRSYLPGARSNYLTLIRTVTDPRTKQDVKLAIQDDEINPVFDDDGYIQRDRSGYPLLLIKPEVEHKKFYWDPNTVPDANMYEWFRIHFYEGKTLLEIWRPAWLGGIFIFFFGTGGLIALDVLAQRRYLKGEAIRGTRELSPKDYERGYREETGFGIKVYTQGRCH